MDVSPAPALPTPFAGGLGIHLPGPGLLFLPLLPLSAHKGLHEALRVPQPL